MRTVTISAMAALCAWVAPARATVQEIEERRVAEIFAAMVFVSDSCPDMVVDGPGLHDALHAIGYDSDDKAAAASIMEQAQGYHASYLVLPDRVKHLCAATWREYGPAGMKARHVFKHSD